jgi:SNF2 family DNA or RNA helicase
MIDIEKIRKIRTLENPVLKPSPYLRNIYIDEYGESHPVELRNYQKIGVMDMLRVTRTLNSDATGLGKTIITLTTLGYIWMIEPEYIPIVVAKKSAIFQWDGEIKKFMQNMEAMVVYGEPYERASIYKDFFDNYSPDRKKLLILTYDNIIKDSQTAVIRDKKQKPNKNIKSLLNKAKKAAIIAKNALKVEKKAFEDYFVNRGENFSEYLNAVLKPSDPDAPFPAPPGNWTEGDEKRLRAAKSARNLWHQTQLELNRARDLVEPPVQTTGLLDHIKELIKRDPKAKIVFVFDEIHTLKSHKSKIHELCAELAACSSRVIGLTATPVENRLMEFFSIFRIIYPQLFPKISHFQTDYCLTKLQPIGGGRKVPIVIGHTKDQLTSFINKIEPFYLSRQKHQVAKELPELITKEIACVLTREQEELYDIAELGLLNEGNNSETDTASMITSMVMVQQACNAPQLLMDEDGNPFEGESSKIETLIDILEEDSNIKTIVFSRFEKMISLIETRFKKEKIKYLRITGKENDPKVRFENAAKFRDMNSGVNVILITTAGSESINLQSAEHIVFIDSPFSWGRYVQLTGRAIRIGSKHISVLATHLVAKRMNGDKTIDNHVIKILRNKKKLADTVAGEALKGGLEFTEHEAVMEIMDLIRSHTSGQSEDIKLKIANIKKSAIKSIRSTSDKKAASKKSAASILNNVVAPALYNDIDFSDI